jgi:hypothetical protein
MFCAKTAAVILLCAKVLEKASTKSCAEPLRQPQNDDLHALNTYSIPLLIRVLHARAI